MNYNNHNSFSLSNVLTSSVSQFWDVFEFNLKLSQLIIIFFLAAIVAYTVRNYTKGMMAEKTNKVSLVLIAIGVFAFVLGAFPYWILGYVPTFNEWGSRHQLLLPLGFSLAFVGTTLFCFPNFLAKWIFSLALGFSLWINVTNYVKLFVDWQKQKA